MKIVITGKHGSGKYEILDRLSQLHIKCGHEFTDCPHTREMYIDPLYNSYKREDVEIIFESNSYITYSSIDDLNIPNSSSYVRGLDLITWDSNEVFVLSPQHVLGINENLIQDDIVYIWIDNDRMSRYNRFREVKSQYNFSHQEQLESQCDDEFTDFIYQKDVLYFNNDKIEHIIGVIYSLVKNPYLLDTYKKLYN